MKDSDSHIDFLTHFPASSVDMKEKQNQNMRSGNLVLAALGIRKYRWWEHCVADITTSYESPIEKEYTKGTHVSVKDSDSNIHGEHEIFGTHFPTSSANPKEKEKENMLDQIERVETLSLGLKAGDAVGCLAYETDKEEKDEEVATGIMTEQERTCDLKSRDALGSLAYEIDKEKEDEEVVTGILTEHTHSTFCAEVCISVVFIQIWYENAILILQLNCINMG